MLVAMTSYARISLWVHTQCARASSYDWLVHVYPETAKNRSRHHTRSICPPQALPCELEHGSVGNVGLLEFAHPAGSASCISHQAYFLCFQTHRVPLDAMKLLEAEQLVPAYPYSCS